MLPALISTMASSCRSCSTATARQIAWKTRRKAGLLVPLDLLHHDQLLAAILLDREGPAAIQPQARVAALDGSLDVLGIVVHAADDDQVLHPAGDEQLRRPA